MNARTIRPAAEDWHGHDPGHDHDHPHDHDHRQDFPMVEIKLTRRELLKGTGLLFGTLALSSTLVLFAPSRSWALELKKLDSHQGEVLLAFARQIFPHATLDDAVYALLVKDLDGKAATDTATYTQLADGVKHLDQLASGDWTKQDAAKQAADTKAVSSTPFFETVRSTGIVSLYNNPLAFKHFGYGGPEGAAGYLDNGFNNLKWLPEPAASISGPIPKG